MQNPPTKNVSWCIQQMRTGQMTDWQAAEATGLSTEEVRRRFRASGRPPKWRRAVSVLEVVLETALELLP